MSTPDFNSAREHIGMAEDAGPRSPESGSHAFVSIAYSLLAAAEQLERLVEALAELKGERDDRPDPA
jgi:hypothetical protein